MVRNLAFVSATYVINPNVSYNFTLQSKDTLLETKKSVRLNDTIPLENTVNSDKVSEYVDINHLNAKEKVLQLLTDINQNSNVESLNAENTIKNINFTKNVPVPWFVLDLINMDDYINLITD
ncbi:hypothetical protein GVAV_001271 [Gurleya vavrai]